MRRVAFLMSAPLAFSYVNSALAQEAAFHCYSLNSAESIVTTAKPVAASGGARANLEAEFQRSLDDLAGETSEVSCLASDSALGAHAKYIRSIADWKRQGLSVRVVAWTPSSKVTSLATDNEPRPSLPGRSTVVGRKPELQPQQGSGEAAKPAPSATSSLQSGLPPKRAVMYCSYLDWPKKVSYYSLAGPVWMKTSFVENQNKSSFMKKISDQTGVEDYRSKNGSCFYYLDKSKEYIQSELSRLKSNDKRRGVSIREIYYSPQNEN